MMFISYPLTFNTAQLDHTHPPRLSGPSSLRSIERRIGYDTAVKLIDNSNPISPPKVGSPTVMVKSYLCIMLP